MRRRRRRRGRGATQLYLVGVAARQRAVHAKSGNGATCRFAGVPLAVPDAVLLDVFARSGATEVRVVRRPPEAGDLTYGGLATYADAEAARVAAQRLHGAVIADWLLAPTPERGVMSSRTRRRRAHAPTQGSRCTLLGCAGARLAVRTDGLRVGDTSRARRRLAARETAARAPAPLGTAVSDGGGRRRRRGGINAKRRAPSPAASAAEY
eukprot:gene4183-9810_t